MVKRAHSKGFNVKPLVGPSSLLLALMSSGMNGQSFAFNGYLPIDKQERVRKIKALEKRSGDYDQTQLFIETPYRNEQFLADLIKILSPNTLLSVACDLTLPSEWIKTAHAKEWKKIEVNLQKRPAIFLFHKELAI